jgi:hypothetical protein
MVGHYIHQGRSIGANFTVAEALGLGHREKFQNEMQGFQEIAELEWTYGFRFEWRLSPWAANKLMQFDPREIMERMFDAGVIVSGNSSPLSQRLSLAVRFATQLPLFHPTSCCGARDGLECSSGNVNYL